MTRIDAYLRHWRKHASICVIVPAATPALPASRVDYILLQYQGGARVSQCEVPGFFYPFVFDSHHGHRIGQSSLSLLKACDDTVDLKRKAFLCVQIHKAPGDLW
jgi:hypothetical protein